MGSSTVVVREGVRGMAVSQSSSAGDCVASLLLGSVASAALKLPEHSRSPQAHSSQIVWPQHLASYTAS